ncbi:MAG: Ig domain-containing protein, partial [Prosthecobacter sp.]|nr:Ig domain-containing protein [Prosthecobacter sp.]
IGGKAHTITQQGVLKPGLIAPVVPPAIVSGYYNLPIPTENGPVTYTVTKLPPGLAINNADGIISGKPTTPGTYHVTVKASNAAGVSNLLSFDIVVTALPTGVIGAFQGFIARDPEINANLGSRLELTTSATGTVTGKIITGATAQPLTGTLMADANDSENPLCLISIPRKDSTPLRFEVTLDHDTDTLAGTLNDGTGNSAEINGWRRIWNATTKKATAYKAYYTFSLEQQEPDDALPQGYGFGSFTVAETTGLLTVNGKLADGSTFTSGAFVGRQGQVLVYQSLYANKGSFGGVLHIAASGVTPAENAINGQPTHFKPAPTPGSKDTIFQAGFGPVPLLAEGAPYTPPAAGKLFMNLVFFQNNAEAQFTRGGLDDEGKEFNMLIDMEYAPHSGTTVAVFLVANPNKVTMPTVAKSTGAFGGEFTILGATTAQNRKVAYQGLVVRHISGLVGYGFFLLPKAPVPPLTLTTSPKLSGRVVLEGTY